MTVFLCSPQKNGVTDHLAHAFGNGARHEGQPVKFVPLREYAIIPCIGCQHCACPPWSCRYASQDDTEQLYAMLLGAEMTVFASPIYFYALPAHFKAFIDRSQKFWSKWRHDPEPGPAPKPAVSIMAAGRPRGNELFSGAMRTLRWYGKPLNLAFEKPIVFRGLDSPKDLRAKPRITQTLFQAGRHYARMLKRNCGTHENCQASGNRS